jgi:hypothetical protein
LADDLFLFDGRSEFEFENPNQLLVHLITFKEVHNCQESGKPTLELTWFPKHAWSFCQCGRCGCHLGWFYRGPQQFTGLIRDRLVRDFLFN